MTTETTAVQDYLKAIHQLGGGAGPVPTTALASQLGVRPASVSGMLRRLHDLGLVSHARYKGVRLTRKGTRQAVEMIRHHRLLELYLSQVVGMPLDKVHGEAEALEHVISEELESRLDELLGHPTEDPHGHPIPTTKLTLSETSYPILSELPNGAHGVVKRVSDRDPALLRHLEELGLRPGARVEIVEHIAYGGGLRAIVDGSDRVIGRKAAEAVGVSA
jgi:DtxR family Mn-dependent transcriptional regulator